MTSNIPSRYFSRTKLPLASILVLVSSLLFVGSFAQAAMPLVVLQNLSIGSRGAAVLELQKFLNEHGTPLAQSGPGSPGSETNYFGPRTRAALARFQAEQKIAGGDGQFFGARTRAVVQKILGIAEMLPTSPTVTPSPATTTIAAPPPSALPPPPQKVLSPELSFYSQVATADDLCPGGRPALPSDPANAVFCANRNKPVVVVATSTPTSSFDAASSSAPATPSSSLLCIFFSAANVNQPISFSALGGGGGYTWLSPDGLPATGSGPSFTTTFSSVGPKTVTVQSVGGSSVCNVAVSAAAPAPAPPSLPQSTTLRILSPNGGERLVVDKDYVIRYSAPKTVKAISIGLRKLSISSTPAPSSIIKNIAPILDENGVGSFTWRPSASMIAIPAENDYLFFIEAADGTALADYSDAAFSIVLQPVTAHLVMAAPSGAQQWNPGELHETRWCANDDSLAIAGTLRLSLIDAAGRWAGTLLERPLAAMPRCSATSNFFWKVGGFLTSTGHSLPAGRYQIEARYVISSGAQERSLALARSDGITLLQSSAP